MKDPLDNQTVDWVEGSRDINKSLMQMFDLVACFIAKNINNKARITTKEFCEYYDVHIRTAQRYMKTMAAMGYLESDNLNPRGYLITEKAKYIFGGAK